MTYSGLWWLQVGPHISGFAEFLLADCYGEPSFNLTRKINSFVGYPDIRVALSEAKPVNPFPYHFRDDAFKINLYPILNERLLSPPVEEKEGSQFIVDLIKEQETEKVEVSHLISIYFSL